MQVDNIEIGPLLPEDRQGWERLARGYKVFYNTLVSDEGYERTWLRLAEERGAYALGARLNGRLVGIAHYFFHASVWLADICYLQDLFVDERYRGKGIARALIQEVARIAAMRGSSRLYWHTRESNARARILYDKVANWDGFIRYDYAIEDQR